ncbi:MAG: hypothetical protein JWO44_2533 [Bacteroidetes bacterium]|nr:hypothetical protein [Bacteroidota bacterium]
MKPALKKSKKDLRASFYGGLSGLQLPVPKYLFPEPHQNSSRLAYYSTFFNSIEVNSTFYKLPLEKTIAGWAATVPDAFRFTFKLWKEITHVKALDFKEEDIEKYFKVIAAAGRKKGCVLIQFPPSLGNAHMMQLDALLRCVKQNNPTNEWKIALEFRNKSWYNEHVYDLLNAYGAAMVVQDIPRSATPMLEHSTDFMYIRFHGPTGNYRDSYSDSFLAEYATYVKEWLSEGKTVYAYFNNTMGDAFKNLQALQIYMNS